MRRGRRPSGHPAHRHLTREHRTTLKLFEAWMSRYVDRIAAPTTHDESEVFVDLLVLAQRLKLDVTRPAHFTELVEYLHGIDDEEIEAAAIDQALEVLHDYSHFHLETAAPGSWDDAHAVVEDAVGAGDPTAAALFKAIEDCRALDESDRQAALADTTVVARVRDLLEWVGAGRAVAPSGGVRRADISTVAGMIDIAAVGVNKRRDRHRGHPALFGINESPAVPATIEALSMSEVPLLAAWWEALHAADVLTRSGTRVRPGPLAEAWLADDSPPIDAASALVAFFVAGVLNAEEPTGFFGGVMTSLAVARLTAAVVPIGEVGLEEALAPPMFRDIFAERTLSIMQDLARVGLVEVDTDGTTTVKPELRGPLGIGIIGSLASLAADAEDDEEDEYPGHADETGETQPG